VTAMIFRRNRGLANRSPAAAGRRWLSSKWPLGNHPAEKNQSRLSSSIRG
jgi:hypothetical protein